MPDDWGRPAYNNLKKIHTGTPENQNSAVFCCFSLFFFHLLSKSFPYYSQLTTFYSLFFLYLLLFLPLFPLNPYIFILLFLLPLPTRNFPGFSPQDFHIIKKEEKLLRIYWLFPLLKWHSDQHFTHFIESRVRTNSVRNNACKLIAFQVQCSVWNKYLCLVFWNEIKTQNIK